MLPDAVFLSCFNCLEGVFFHWCSRSISVVHFTSTEQMPSLKMKTKTNVGCLREKNGLHVCQKSSIISKKVCSNVRISEHAADLHTCIRNCQDGKQLNLKRLCWFLKFCQKLFGYQGLSVLYLSCWCSVVHMVIGKL